MRPQKDSITSECSHRKTGSCGNKKTCGCVVQEKLNLHLKINSLCHVVHHGMPSHQNINTDTNISFLSTMYPKIRTLIERAFCGLDGLIRNKYETDTTVVLFFCTINTTLENLIRLKSSFPHGAEFDDHCVSVKTIIANQ
jgi:hypothetical protein